MASKSRSIDASMASPLLSPVEAPQSAGAKRVTVTQVALRALGYFVTALACATILGAIYCHFAHKKNPQSKTYLLGVEFFAALGLVTLALTPVIGWGILYGIHRYVIDQNKKKQEICEKLFDGVLKHLKTHLKTTKLEEDKVPEEFKEAYSGICKIISGNSTVIENPLLSRGKKYDAIRRSRKLLDEILKDERLSNHPEFRRHINNLAKEYRSHKIGPEQLRELGQIVNPLQERDRYTLKDVADAINNVISNPSLVNKNTLLGFIFYYIIHPSQLASAFSTHREKTGRDYNSYAYGNIDMFGCRYCIKRTDGTDHTMDFHFGPGPQSDRLFEGHIQAAQEADDDTRFIQINLQQETGSEGHRTTALANLYRDLKGFDYHMSVSMDGEGWEVKDPKMKKATTVDAFCDAFYDYITRKNAHRKMGQDHDTRNGYYIPNLSDEEITQAVDAVKEAFGEDRVLTSVEEKKAFQLYVQTFLTLKLMAKASKGRSHSHFGQACKQDIDRGVAANILTRLFMMKIAGQPIDQATVYEVIGAVVGRPYMVDKRDILMERIAPAIKALQMASDNTILFEKLKQYAFPDATISVETPSV